jgi:hypothetical protein
MFHPYTADQLVEQPAIYFFMSSRRWAASAQILIRRTRDLLLPRLLSGQVELPIGE